ncbi:MAG: DUF4124 domain-containing protein [Burkholderiales bacterium]|jgi:hypothetical protein|nr:DUF4124 domain-containing protein [Burkholderiales bacterium]
MQRFSLHVLVLLIGSFIVIPAAAQWKWRDKNGAIQYSDLPPPPGVPAQDVLQRSSTGRQGVNAAVDPGAAAASAPKAGTDPELEARRRKAEQATTDKAKAEERVQAERIAAAKAENCGRAKSHMKSLEDGLRVVRTNASGEHEVLDDRGRAAEKARASEIISSDCR